MLNSLKSQVGLLASMQALVLTNNVTLVAITGLAGFQLADNKLMATLPVTGYVLGGAVWAMPAAAFMKRFGRRAGYTVGSVAGMTGALAAWWAMTQASLVMLCLATFVTGLYSAFAASLRFAAADVADTYKPTFKARAISLVLAGGIVGGVLGPEISKWSRTWLPTQFAGSYLVLVGFALLSMALAQLLRLPTPAQAAQAAASGEPARPLAEILRQPLCWAAILTSAMGYGIMNLLMVATPLAMEVCKHPYASAALVLEWHVIGMFLPGLFTGGLITRFGVLPVIVTGCLLMLGCVAIALTGVDLMQFLLALTLLGVGWNFMYTGATTMLTTAYRPSEKNKVQGFMDLCVFTTMVTTSASSGAMLMVNGWSVLNLVSLPIVLVVLCAALWLSTRTGWGLGRVRAQAA
ncbi:MAG TPA: MFS transporter [Burkholderiaceae bacterium]|nr:MFS transporter [Burkholderiaceae bacterium]